MRQSDDTSKGHQNESDASGAQEWKPREFASIVKLVFGVSGELPIVGVYRWNDGTESIVSFCADA